MILTFSPIYGSTVSISVSAVPSSASLGSLGDLLLFTNLGASKCYVRIHTGSTAAQTTDMVVQPNKPIVIHRPVGYTVLSARCDAGQTCTLKATLGRRLLSMKTTFAPINASGVSLSVTDSSAATSALSTVGDFYLLSNTGTNKCYFKIDEDSTATTNDCPILAGTQIFIPIRKGTIYLSAICDGGETATLKISRGY